MFSLTDGSLYVAALDLWIDSARRRRRGYVSHGHADHAREHATVVCTPGSARVCRTRFRNTAGEVAFEEHAFNEPWAADGHRLTLFPAGHVLGSSQLLIEGDAGAFVYTGDFKLAGSATSEPIEVKRCDVLVMECTYGHPRYVFPPRAELEARIVAFATRALADGCAPVFFAYSLGKAQEALAILTRAGLAVSVHAAAYAMARAYEAAGVPFGSYERYDPQTYDGHSALIWPPSPRTRPPGVPGRPLRSAVLTGWALAPEKVFRLGAVEAIPLSDHADFPALLRYVELAQPRTVVLNHGRRDFVHHVQRLGIEATYLEPNEQLALF